MTEDRDRWRQWRRVLLLTALAFNLVAAVVMVAENAGRSGGFLQQLSFAPILAAYTVVGAVILWRRRHPIGWLLLLMGMLLSGSHFTELLLERPAPIGTTGPAEFLTVAAKLPFPLFAALLPAVGLRFPDGRLLSLRWRWLEAAYVTGVVAVTGAMLLARSVRGGVDGHEWQVTNPLWSPTVEALRIALELTATVLLFPSVFLSIVALMLRFRRSTGLARQQLRWLVYPVAVVLLSWPLLAGAAWLLAGWKATGAVSEVYSMVILAVPPVGMGVAITRHGLYDLQRFVSRTVAYVVLSLFLALLYTAAVLGISATARAVSGETGDAVVALSTLVVAAAFRPLRAAVQGVVDRRFNRTGYNAARIVGSFGRVLRDELDLRAITRQLEDSAAAALQPGRIGVVLLRVTP